MPYLSQREGKPVVGARVGGIPEVVGDGETGRLVPPGDSAALADPLVGLLQVVDECGNMGRTALARKRAGHDFAQSVDRFVTTYGATPSAEAVTP